MLDNYFPILLFIIVGVAVGVAPMLLGVHRPDSQKLSVDERRLGMGVMTLAYISYRGGVMEFMHIART